NDFVRSHITGYGYGIEPQSASTLDDHGLAKAQPGAMQAIEHLRERTINWGSHVIRDVVGEFKDIVIGTQIIVISVCIVKIGWRPSHAVGTCLARATAHFVL